LTGAGVATGTGAGWSIARDSMAAEADVDDLADRAGLTAFNRSFNHSAGKFCRLT
jgi:hypothetical protein